MIQGTIAPLRRDRQSVYGAAATICSAFGKDPLIGWLRPNGKPWSNLESNVIKWQCRRIDSFLVNGKVLAFYTAQAENLHDTTIRAIPESILLQCSRETVAAVALIETPTKRWSWNPAWVYDWLRLQLLELVNPLVDEDSHMERVEQMLNAHDLEMDIIRKCVYPRDVWYIEVVAVNPSFQGHRLGRQMMEVIMEQAKGDFVVLECTDFENVKFYEKFGFILVKEIQLSVASTSDGDVVSTWFMICESA